MLAEIPRRLPRIPLELHFGSVRGTCVTAKSLLSPARFSLEYPAAM
jgi:hypothetical protein